MIFKQEKKDKKKRDVSSPEWWTASLGDGGGRGAGRAGSIEQARFTLAPKIICTDKFADFAHSTHLIE